MNYGKIELLRAVAGIVSINLWQGFLARGTPIPWRTKEGLRGLCVNELVQENFCY